MLTKIKNGAMIVILLAALGTLGFGAFSRWHSNPAPPTPIVPIDNPDLPSPKPEVLSKAEIIVTAPDKVAIGQLIRVDISNSKGKTYKWRTIPENLDIEVYDGGKKVCFSSPKVGIITLIVASANENDVDLKVIQITVGEPVIIPPGPGPVVPTTLTGKVANWVTTLVKTENVKEEAAKLAASFNSIAAQIDKGTLTDVDKIADATSASNRAALKTTITDWMPFLTQLQKEFKSQAQAGTLVTAEQHAEVWKEVARGLEIASK